MGDLRAAPSRGKGLAISARVCALAHGRAFAHSRAGQEAAGSAGSPLLEPPSRDSPPPGVIAHHLMPLMIALAAMPARVLLGGGGAEEGSGRSYLDSRLVVSSGEPSCPPIAPPLSAGLTR